ncbi:hypothetical protein D9757_006325 [Collybiopsis confluens]|uniref:FAD dependent oxidoreductase domain-containing protein n=1 Tax=Collybiopsis confluens TaxID=2823264 RepID=A0A8H5M6X2_9AGAR|nr:hypothetical protein D9757_006325 [Collybiopsis confluens]
MDMATYFRLIDRCGEFSSLILSDDGKTCLGAVTKDGTLYLADRVILASGAWTPSLIDLQDQCCSRAWVYAHMQITPDEAKEYTNCPVVYNEDFGFFFEPNKHGIIAEPSALLRGESRESEPKLISISPRSHARHPLDTYPDASEESIRRAIQVLLPKFKDRELFNRTM